MTRKKTATVDFEAMRLEHERAMKEEYPTKLMTVLERASKHCMDIHVTNGRFLVDGTYGMGKTFGPVFDLDSYNELDDLEKRLDDLDIEVQRERQRMLLRQSALAKLTQDERDALDL